MVLVEQKKRKKSSLVFAKSNKVLCLLNQTTNASKLDRVQATMERIGGFQAEPLAARREAALITLTLKQLDGDCRGLLREYAPVLVIVKVPEVKVARSQRPGLLRPDYSEKNQSRRTSTSSAGVKVDVNLAPGVQDCRSRIRPRDRSLQPHLQPHLMSFRIVLLVLCPPLL